MNNSAPNNFDHSNTYPVLIQALCQPEAYTHPVETIQLVETHISWIILTGTYAYKIKKPVKFGFLDFSSLQQRQEYCHEELRLNNRFSEHLYLAVVEICGTETQPKVEGHGNLVEYAVKMRQFPTHQLLSELADAGQLFEPCCEQFPAILAHFHAHIERASVDCCFGTGDSIRKWVDENFTQLLALTSNDHDRQKLQQIQLWGEERFSMLLPTMTQRKQDGWVRECHGDLHLGNMTLIDEQVVIFDCIEFNAELRWIDVLNDVAFLVFDLYRHGYAVFARRLLNDYLMQTGDYAGLALMPYYLVYRALVRAKVSLLRLRQMTSPDDIQDTNLARDFSKSLQIAENFTFQRMAHLFITHGFSGSGKSTCARHLVDQFGIIQLRSDCERKRCMADKGVDLYSSNATQQTYAVLVDLARSVLNAGYSVIVDATFLKGQQRQQFRQLAEDCQIPFGIISLQASQATLLKRIEQRGRYGNDPSDATAQVLLRQMDLAEPLTDQEQANSLIIDTEQSGAWSALIEEVKSRVGKNPESAGWES